MQQPMTREERLTQARAIAQRARNVYGVNLKAIRLYGSMARGTDGPYSDIEMFCVLRSEGEEFSYEWVAGPWKAEVDFHSEEILLRKAARVEGRWPLTHGPYFTVLSLYDPDSFFAQLRAAASSPTDKDFQEAICATLTGEVYEFASKWQNARATGATAYLYSLAAQTAQYGAFLIGLHHRRTYSTGSTVLSEALTLPNRPDGFDPVAEMVMTGRLSDPTGVLDALDSFWKGVQTWANTHGYPILSPREIPF